MEHEETLGILERGIVDIITREQLLSKLFLDRPLNVKFGIDPTAPDIHLGHTVPIHKLRQFQEMGHKVQLVIGDYTAIIGDPSGRSETRPMLSREHIESNLATYTDQVFKILDRDRTELFMNSRWLSNLSSSEIVDIASRCTVQQMLQRRDFSERLKSGKPLSVSEIMYPLLVGYDSVVLKSDIEIGGTDQLFNFMASRDIQKAYGQEPEVIMTLPLLEGTDGIKKMSKSLGNAIGVDEEPLEMFGKMMSLSDELMLRFYELISGVTNYEFDRVRNAVKTGSENPMIYKQKLALEVVSRYHGLEEARRASNYFDSVHRKLKHQQT